MIAAQLRAAVCADCLHGRVMQNSTFNAVFRRLLIYFVDARDVYSIAIIDKLIATILYTVCTCPNYLLVFPHAERVMQGSVANCGHRIM